MKTRRILASVMTMAVMTANMAVIPQVISTSNPEQVSITAEAANYQPRTKAPAAGSKWYRAAENPYYPKFGMPNCTAYAYGRISEILGKSSGLPVANAQNWYSKDTKYEHGSKPMVGSVVCWSNAKGSLGHVAVVEQVFSDEKISISESSFNGKYFEYKTINPKTYCSKSYGYHLQGYIYCSKEKKSSDSHQKDMLSNGSNYTIQMKDKALYLSSNGTAKNKNVQLSSSKTVWTAVYDTSTDSWIFKLKSKPTLVLNLAADRIVSKTNSNLWTFVNHDKSQQFKLVKNGNCYNILSAANQNIALDCYGSMNSQKNGSNVWSYTFSKTEPTQMFVFNKVS